jgi:hypothetical protein
MDPSAFLDRSRPPGPKELEAVLGKAAPLWKELNEKMAALVSPLTREWAWSGAKLGWTLRLGWGKRPMLYMTPCCGYFRASLALGEKAVAAARKAKLPAGLLSRIEDAPKFPEGRAVRLEVRTAKDLPGIAKVAAIKMAS